jgi:hypothetical protein
MSFRNLVSATIVALAWAAMCQNAPAAIIASYQFGSGTTLGSPATTVAPLVTASLFADGDGGTSYSSAVGSPAVPSVEKAYPEIALRSDYLNSNSYFEFTLSATPGFELELSQLSFDYDKNQLSGTGPRPTITFDLRSSLDNYAFTLGTVNDPGNAATGTFQTSINNLDSVADDITFRLYVAKDLATFSAGLVHIDNVKVEGNVVAVNPEPASLVIWGGIGIAGLVAAWRRKKLAS